MATKKRRIDSYGKLFPLVENEKNTAVYRLSIYLKRKIDLSTLYKAVELTLKEFPDFKVTLKKTFFNYYLEPINNDIIIFKETNDACSKIDLKATNGYIFKISYGPKNINIDFYHILTDGTGATLFTRILIEHYLDLIGNKPITVEDILYCKDSYIALASSNNSPRIKKKSENSSSYVVKGKYLKTGCNITHLITDLQPIIQFCKKNNITVTGYITSILAKSIYETNKEYIKGNKKIKFSIPVDLRKFYDYKTVSNFFEYFNVNITKEEAAKDFTYLFNKVKNTFKEELHAEYFNYRVHQNVKILNQHFTKIIPLFIKKTISNLAYSNFVDSGTVLLSNIGKIPFSSYYQQYINYAFFIPNPEKTNLKCSICSTNDKLCISFATYFKDNIIENKCYEYLKKEGFNVILKNNYL